MSYKEKQSVYILFKRDFKENKKEMIGVFSTAKKVELYFNKLVNKNIKIFCIDFQYYQIEKELNEEHLFIYNEYRIRKIFIDEEFNDWVDEINYYKEKLDEYKENENNNE